MAWREAWVLEPIPGTEAKWGGWAAGGAKGTEDGSGGMPASPDGSWFSVFSNGEQAEMGGWTYADQVPASGSVRVRTRLWASTPTSKVGVGLEALRADGSTVAVVQAGATVAGGTGAWQDIEYTVQLPLGTTQVRPIFNISRIGDGNADPTWAGLDYIEIDTWEADRITGLSGENLLRNGGFRDGLTWWTAAGFQVWDETWQSVEPIADGDTNNEALTSSFLGYVNDTAGAPTQWPSVQQDVPVQEGRTYTVSMMAYVNQPAGSASVQVKMLDASKRQVREVRVNVQQPGVWAPVTATFVVQPGEAFANVVLFCTVPAETRAWIDQAQMVEGSRRVEWENTGSADLGGKTYPGIEIDGLRYDHLTRSASWQLGRSWWMAGPEVGTCTVELVGDRTEVNPGDRINIIGHPHPGRTGTQFRGVVDDVTVDVAVEDGEVVSITRVSATDFMGWLGRVNVTGWTQGTTSFNYRMQTLMELAKVPDKTLYWMPPGTQVPDVPAIEAHNNRQSLQSIMDAAEKASNAIVQIDNDGVWRVQRRVALGAANPATVVSLDLPANCPSSAALDRQSVQKTINRWVFKDGENAYSAAQSLFGTAEYTIPWTKAEAATRYPAEMLNAMAVPATTWNVVVPVTRRAAEVTKIGPFDYVLWRDRAYQSLQIAHNVTPDGWEVAIHLDSTQNVISGGSTGDETTPPADIPPDAPPPTIPTPDAPPPTPEPPPAVRKRATINVTANKDAMAVLTTGGLNAGNGGGPLALVGKMGDGTLSRMLIGFPTQTFLGRNRTVVSATLTTTVERSSCMGWGGSPKFKVQRITASWSEGSYSVTCGFASSNAVKWPGPSATSTGEVTKSHAQTDGLKVATRIDAIAQAWLDGQAQQGVRLVGYTETNDNYRTSFDCAGAGKATLQIVYDYDE